MTDEKQESHNPMSTPVAKSNETTVLANSGADYVTSAAKSVLGIVPFAGSLLAEVAGTIIPN